MHFYIFSLVSIFLNIEILKIKNSEIKLYILRESQGNVVGSYLYVVCYVLGWLFKIFKFVLLKT